VIPSSPQAYFGTVITKSKGIALRVSLVKPVAYLSLSYIAVFTKGYSSNMAIDAGFHHKAFNTVSRYTQSKTFQLVVSIKRAAFLPTCFL
jgi:hypothetical protein